MGVMRTAVPVLLAVYAYFITPPWHSLRWDYLKTLTDSSRLHQPNLNPYIQSSVGQPAEGVAHAGLAHALARNLTGKVAVVTGGNAGLGFATVKRLAKQGATVIMGARDPQKAMAAIQSLGLGVDVGFSQLDLASLESIRGFAKALPSKIDILVLNAGKAIDTYEKTADEIFEWSFGTMHIGHFYLTHLLHDKLSTAAVASGDVRVVVLSSMAHLLLPLRPDWTLGLFDPARAEDAWEFPTDYLSFGGAGIWKRYAMAKAANVFFARELHRRVAAKGLKIYVNSVHPGVVATTINPWFSVFLQFLPQAFTMEEGALTQLYCALATQPAIPDDAYFNPLAKNMTWGVHTSPGTADPGVWEELWEFSVKHIQRIDPAFTPSF
mmetsp:Transcript_19179/g.46014  ORF Transcript_19179/g.46014 Transcript_19179/m.46014 type:complete len:380 (+) Transcript_19179:121-1260(+)